MAECMVCGSTLMAKSHLFPRGLMHDMRKGAAHLIGVSKGKPETRFLQSGPISRLILCHAHEKSTQVGDDYAIRLCRRYPGEAEPIGDGLAVTIANPHPRRLTLFAHATIWRHAAHLQTQGRSNPLGGRFDAVSDIVFRGAEPFEVLVIDPGRLSGGHRATVAIGPAPWRFANRNLLRFEVGGLSFAVNLSPEPLPDPFNKMLTQKDPLLVLRLTTGELTTDPMIREIASAIIDAEWKKWRPDVERD